MKSYKLKSNKIKSNKLKINKKHRGEIAEALTMLTQIGILMVVSILMGLFAGRFLDRLLGTSPWLMLVFIIMGTIAGFRNIYAIVTKRWK